MADDDQMSRADLLDAKKRVELQLERLSYASVSAGGTTPVNPKVALRAELNELLEEINFELERPDA
jgi:hypothetical protein